MKPYEDILEDDEKISWSKEFPSRDVRPNKKKKLLGHKISIMIYVAMFIICIITFIILGIQFGRGIELISGAIFVSLVIIFIIILNIWGMRSDWKISFELYSGFLKFYSDEQLENFPTYHIVTNKKLLTNYVNDEDWFCFINPIFYVEDIIKYEKDFLTMNLKYLYKIQIRGSSGKHGKYAIQFFFDKSDPEKMLKIIENGDLKKLKGSYLADIEECQYFHDLSKQELEDITKILLEMNPKLIIEKWKLFS